MVAKRLGGVAHRRVVHGVMFTERGDTAGELPAWIMMNG